MSDEDSQNQSKQMAFIAKLTKLVRDQEDETAIRDPYIKFSLTCPDSDIVSKSAY